MSVATYGSPKQYENLKFVLRMLYYFILNCFWESFYKILNFYFNFSFQGKLVPKLGVKWPILGYFGANVEKKWMVKVCHICILYN